ncbi:hypothetical protein VE01_10059 [Pseudogymnoascus verrucosus]|uniref:beta-glucosidase n=1 Tax=Pseudogymnoascus verrucosus TaxID=342668 RepID=A0A1B8G8L7_9PEZI|nr:uncharacterized protein VE01_10059 [Pseudogymnoascus verrucosus]OBT92179.1 hypothetical protein VE01_10059 [Pseudogymnoascus verrucosus]
MATVDIPVALATDLSKHATTPATHGQVTQVTTEISPSDPIIKQLTIEEKVQLLSGRNFVSTAGVARLGIPPLKLVDTVNGVKGSDLHNGTSTLCFPSTACLGATWNRELLTRMGKKLAAQAKSKSAQVILGPSMNMHRDPRGGRNFEFFSEDPLLTGELGAALVNAIQSEGVGACPKHFVGNECETKRRIQDVTESLDGRTMREIYLAAFQVMLRNSDPMALMTAYNKVDGVYCSENIPLIQDVLRGDWGYKGCVMSDWYGTNSETAALKAGLDLEMPGPSVFRGASLVKNVQNGTVDEKLVDQRLANVLRLIERTAESHSTEPEKSLNDESGNCLAKEIGTEGIVLLQNRKSVLPLQITQKLAVIGSAATTPPISGGGSASAPPQYLQRPIDSIKALHSHPEFVTGSEGVKVHATIPICAEDQIFARNGEHGVDVSYFNDRIEMPITEEFQKIPQVVMLGRIKPGLKAEGFHYEMSTTLIPTTTGLHTIGIHATGSFLLTVNGKEVLSETVSGITVEDFLFKPERLEVRCQVEMKAGMPYFLKLVVQPHKPASMTGEPLVHGAKLCYIEEYSDCNAISEAVAVAEHADATIIFAGRNSEYESEGFDLPEITLPANQVKMIKKVAAASRRSVLILHCGNPIDVRDFIDDVDAIICAHFLGQEGGNALAEILYGKVNPSGKLAVTWPKKLEDTPSYQSFPATETARGWEISCGEGIGLGYRHNWVNSPQFAFGFGLSYTSFELSSLKVTRSNTAASVGDNEIIVEVELSNTGPVSGAEVVQVYVEDVASSVTRPSRELKAFEKTHLEPQTSETIRFFIKDKYAFSYWDEETRCWRAEAGEFKIHVGDLVAQIHLEQGFSWKGL